MDILIVRLFFDVKLNELHPATSKLTSVLLVLNKLHDKLLVPFYNVIETIAFSLMIIALENYATPQIPEHFIHYIVYILIYFQTKLNHWNSQ